MVKAPDRLIDALHGIAYTVDMQGVVTDIGNPNWSAFAEGNGAPEMIDRGSVVGRPLLDFVIGDDVRATYILFMDKLKEGSLRRVAFGFNCDAPSVSRQMVMAITPMAEAGNIGGLLFQSILVSEEIRPPLDIFDFQALREHDDLLTARPLIFLCSFCQKVSHVDDTPQRSLWITAEEYYRSGGDSEVQISHRTCPGCRERFED